MRLRIAVAALTVAAGTLGPLGSASAGQAGCTITGSPLLDNIHGTSGRDVICPLAESDRVLARAGHDVVIGAGGNDLVYGNGGRDLLRGGAGADTLVGGAGNDTLRGGSKNDVIDAIDGSGGDVVRGGPGFDICYVEAGDTFSGCERGVVV